MAVKANLIIDQGADYEFTFELDDDNDQPIDLVGWTGVAVMRKYYTSNLGYDFDVSINDQDAEVTISMDHDTTSCIKPGRYLYDCELTDPDGKVSRVLEGIVTINARVCK